ncbi:hypothetical protein ILUMI_23848 [Ignelater luminosus]|uniref:Oligopeptide transporter 1 n=1 Tax=Ignelater luminosus TaxID=2038154 RepID=A0A8K0C838_IGNLU|nr:hypothetical protein ILUMI_23848 [Ignelater luminosus]
MEKDKYPTSIFCIIATEFCERFSFCGLRTILSLYLRNELMFSENTATVIYHVFIMICYIIPVIGAICADSYLGRYRTILYFSIIYLVGSIIMCLAAVPTLEFSPIGLTACGLSLIAIGTGGIKPCVAAFGGDQFHLPNQQKLLRQFFSIFYFSINLGGFVGTILTPILRKRVTCFGEDTCYALGFGFPAALMFLALSLFVMGKPFYRLKTPKENIVLRFICCAVYALVERSKDKEREKEHWLDYARDKYPGKLICDMKILFAVFLLYTPLPLFWSLFDQQGSRWTFQASRMNGAVFGTQILPDQMQVINPAIVLILIPVFDRIIIPCMDRIHIFECSLHRMALGGLVAGFAFLSAGIVELALERTYPHLPGKHKASMDFINTLPCTLVITSPFNDNYELRQSEMHLFKDIAAHNTTEYPITVVAPLVCGNLTLERHHFKLKIHAIEFQIETIIVGINHVNHIKSYVTDPVDFKKSLSGKPRIRIAYIKSSQLLHNVSVALENTAGLTDIYFVNDKLKKHLAVSAYMELPPGVYKYRVQCQEVAKLYENEIQIALGGVYTLVLRERNGKIEFAKMYTMSPPNTVNMLWLIPQYFLISVAEIMFGVAGLEFSFTQAPKSLKTITLAAWYLSVAIGNLLVIIVTQARFFKSQAHEFLLFAVLIVADMMVFTEMSVKYEIVQLEADSSCFVMNSCKEVRCTCRDDDGNEEVSLLGCSCSS